MGRSVDRRRVMQGRRLFLDAAGIGETQGRRGEERHKIDVPHRLGGEESGRERAPLQTGPGAGMDRKDHTADIGSRGDGFEGLIEGRRVVDVGRAMQGQDRILLGSEPQSIENRRRASSRQGREQGVDHAVADQVRPAPEVFGLQIRDRRGLGRESKLR